MQPLSRRDQVLKIYNKKDLIRGFDFDAMLHQPISFYLTYQDVQELYRIATSAKLSGKPKKKYELIDSIMEYRGFTRLHAGTNRLVYKSEYDPTIVLKVGLDRVGISDNPKEFAVQHVLKPFCCKVFDVTPCGTVAMVERVEAIRNRYQFEEIASDVFEIVMSKFAGLVMEDIGCNFFMNWGVRRGFGPVVLDYPYTYILDGEKLKCTYRDKMTGVICNGLIDYDEGLNTLVCERCGTRYSARELSKTQNLITPIEKIEMEDETMLKGFVVTTTIHGKNHVFDGKEKATKVIKGPNVVAHSSLPKEVIEPIPDPIIQEPVKEIAVEENKSEENENQVEIDDAIEEGENSEMSRKAQQLKPEINRYLIESEEMEKWWKDYLERDDYVQDRFPKRHADELIEFATPLVINKFEIDEKSARAIVLEFVYVNGEVDEDDDPEAVEVDDHYDEMAHQYMDYDEDEDNSVKKVRSTKFKEF